MEDPIGTEVVAMEVVLIPTVLVGIRHVGNDMGVLVVLWSDGPTITPDVEVVVELMGAFSCWELMFMVG